MRTMVAAIPTTSRAPEETVMLKSRDEAQQILMCKSGAAVDALPYVCPTLGEVQRCAAEYDQVWIITNRKAKLSVIEAIADDPSLDRLKGMQYQVFAAEDVIDEHTTHSASLQ